jgi:isopentenyl diphosphate isomerase/L-lactate dehydrogenase-like FMN-dependent dehydrogenase
VSVNTRRRFLRYLAASPLVPYLDLSPSFLFGGQTPARDEDVLAAAKDAVNVFDFEPVARKKLPPAHFGYLATGTDDDGTIKANREGFLRYSIRVRRLIDVSKIDTSASLLGARWETPILLCPVGSQKAFHPEGEIAVARAARAKNHLQVLSTVTTSSVEDVVAARGAPVWFQLYHREDWNQTKHMVKRAEAAGCPAVVLTVDLLGGSNRETLVRAARADTRQCATCHLGGNPAPGRSGRVEEADNRRRPMLAEIAPGTAVPEVGTPSWEFVQRLKDATSMKVLLKGIVTREDAELAMEHGVSGLFVSNHGGRAENSLRATIECVPEVVAGVAGRAPVIVDGGFRRGTDIFKALALGATAVGIGRPYIWGLAAFGQEGVETVLDILRAELQLVMRQAGTTSVPKITREYIVDRTRAVS